MVHSSWIIIFFVLGVCLGALIGFGITAYFYEHH